MTKGRLLLRIKHQKTPTASANEFTSKSPMFPRNIVPLVDLRIGHTASPLSFVLPMGIHDLRELAKVTVLNSLLALLRQSFHKMEVVDHCFIGAFAPIVLFFQNL